jgi:hypothetical protein
MTFVYVFLCVNWGAAVFGAVFGQPGQRRNIVVARDQGQHCQHGVFALLGSSYTFSAGSLPFLGVIHPAKGSCERLHNGEESAGVFAGVFA